MNFSAIKLDHHIIDVGFTETALHYTLADGREIFVPLVWFPKLLAATETQRKNWKLIGRGIGVHWPDIDEDIAVSTLLYNKE